MKKKKVNQVKDTKFKYNNFINTENDEQSETYQDNLIENMKKMGNYQIH